MNNSNNGSNDNNNNDNDNSADNNKPEPMGAALEPRSCSRHQKGSAPAKRILRPTGTKSFSCQQFQDCLKPFSSEVHVSLEG